MATDAPVTLHRARGWERQLGVYETAPGCIRTGWTMNITDKAIAVIFEPRYWERCPDAERNIDSICLAIGKGLRAALKQTKESE